MRTIAGITIGYPAYAPALEISIQRGGSVEQIYGTIEWNGRDSNLSDIIQNYFDGDDFQYFMLRHLSGHRAINADLMNELGLSYTIIRLGDDGPIPIRLRTTSIEDVRGHGGKFLADFPDANPAMSGGLVELFLKYEQEFEQVYERQSLAVMEAELSTLKTSKDQGEDQYWSGTVEQCEVCKRSMTSDRFMIDSAIAPHGPWACMCAVCFGGTPQNIGWGTGQLYERTERGWLRVGGGPPENEIDT